MSQSADHNKNYTSADIQQYLDGKMDASEMHAFEKALMDDPFLADAMEGLQQTNLQFGKETFTNELEQLEKQLDARVAAEKTAPVVPISGFRWWKVAAAAVVIIVAGVFAFNSLSSPSEKEESPIALNNNKETTAPAINSAADSTTPKYDTFARGTERVPPKFNIDDNKESANKSVESKKSFETDKNTINSEIAQDASAPSVASSKNIADQKEEVAVLRKEAAPAAVKADTVEADYAARSAEKQKDVEARQKAAPQISGYSKGNGYNNTYKGLLISPDNKPVANANFIINQKEKAITDANGFFNFSNKDSQVFVTVTSPGFKARNFTLKNSYAYNELQIEPANDGDKLEESVTINKKSAKERTNAFINYPKVMVQDAEPVKGWIDFENYIDANRKNIQHLDSKPGDVVISFVVNAQGALSSFKVEQSLTEAQDEEALRLIKTGPSWHVLKGKKARVVVIIRF